jgi:hypothetical protein
VAASSGFAAVSVSVAKPLESMLSDCPAEDMDASSALATDSTMRLAATAPLTGESTQPGVHATSDHLAASMSSAGQSDSVAAKRIVESVARADEVSSPLSDCGEMSTLIGSVVAPSGVSTTASADETAPEVEC